MPGETLWCPERGTIQPCVPRTAGLSLGSTRRVSETRFYQLVQRARPWREDQAGLRLRKDQEAKGRANTTGNPGSDGGTSDGALRPSPAVQPVPGCRPSSHVINRKRTITCPHAGPADQSPKGAEASRALSPLLPPRASGFHTCARTRDTALGAIPGSRLMGLGSPTLGQKTLLETSQ